MQQGFVFVYVILLQFSLNFFKQFGSYFPFCLFIKFRNKARKKRPQIEIYCYVVPQKSSGIFRDPTLSGESFLAKEIEGQKSTEMNFSAIVNFVGEHLFPKNSIWERLHHLYGSNQKTLFGNQSTNIFGFPSSYICLAL